MRKEREVLPGVAWYIDGRSQKAKKGHGEGAQQVLVLCGNNITFAKVNLGFKPFESFGCLGYLSVGSFHDTPIILVLSRRGMK